MKGHAKISLEFGLMALGILTRYW